MKIYTRIEMDICTGRILSSDSFEYSGPMAWCGGGDETATGSALGAEGTGGKSMEADPMGTVQGGFDKVTGDMMGKDTMTRLPANFQGTTGDEIAAQVNSQQAQPWQQRAGYPDDYENMGRPAVDATGADYRDMTPAETAAFKKWSVLQDKNNPLSLMDRALPFLPMAFAAPAMMAAEGASGLAAGGDAMTSLGVPESAMNATLAAQDAAAGATMGGAAAGAGGGLAAQNLTGVEGMPPQAQGSGTAGTPAGTPAGTTPGAPPAPESTLLQDVGKGAARGAVTSGVQGDNPFKGAALGGLTGGLTSGINTALSDVSSAAPAATGLDAGSGSFSAPGEAFGGAAPTAPPPVSPADQGVVSKAMKALGLYDPKTGTLGSSALPLALSAGGQVMAQRSKNSLQNQLTAAAKPAAGAADQLLKNGLNGQVPPAVMQQFDLSYKQKVAEISQRFANMGRDPKTDSAAQAEMQKAKDAMDAQVANYASTLTTQGLQAAGLAQGPTTQAALAGAQQDQALQQSMASAMQQMAMLTAMQGNKQGAPAP